jgi:predicted DNA-binding transcriptional regulator AlpA
MRCVVETNNKSSNETLRVNDICARLHCSRATVYRLIKTGNFPRPIKFGAAQQCSARWLIEDVDQWINGRRGVVA